MSKRGTVRSVPATESTETWNRYHAPGLPAFTSSETIQLNGDHNKRDNGRPTICGGGGLPTTSKVNHTSVEFSYSSQVVWLISKQSSLIESNVFVSWKRWLPYYQKCLKRKINCYGHQTQQNYRLSLTYRCGLRFAFGATRPPGGMYLVLRARLLNSEKSRCPDIQIKSPH